MASEVRRLSRRARRCRARRNCAVAAARRRIPHWALDPRRPVRNTREKNNDRRPIGGSERILPRHPAPRARVSSLGRDDTNGSAFRAERNFPFVRPAAWSVPGETLPSTTSSTLRRRVTSQTKLLHPRAQHLAPRRASGSRLAHPRLVLRGHLISEVSSPQSSRLPRVQQRPVRFPSLRRVLHGYSRLRAQCLAVPARESRVEWAGSVRASDGRGAGRGGRRGEARAGAAGDLERASCSCPCTPRWPPIGPRTSRARRIGSNA